MNEIIKKTNIGIGFHYLSEWKLLKINETIV